MKNNEGISMVELIIVMALLFIVLPFSWSYITSSIEDSNALNNKMIVQTTVNNLMTQLQRDIQEARCPINPNSSNFIDVKDDGFLIRKPNGTDSEGHIVYQSVLYKYDADNDKVIVKSGLELDYVGSEVDDVIETANTFETVYNFIGDISLTREGDKGIKVYIHGQIDDNERSGYTLTNTYYTRNTI